MAVARSCKVSLTNCLHRPGGYTPANVERWTQCWLYLTWPMIGSCVCDLSQLRTRSGRDGKLPTNRVHLRYLSLETGSCKPNMHWSSTMLCVLGGRNKLIMAGIRNMWLLAGFSRLQKAPTSIQARMIITECFTSRLPSRSLGRVPSPLGLLRVRVPWLNKVFKMEKEEHGVPRCTY